MLNPVMRLKQLFSYFAFVPCLLLMSMFQTIQAQQDWEMRVCADPDNYPISNEAQEGFENKIVSLLAEELGAELSYVWTPINQTVAKRELRPGNCDLIMGVGESASELLNSIAYFQIPYVFLYLKDATYLPSSLDAAELKNLKIATYPNGAPHIAMVDYGLGDNLVRIPADRSTGGAERSSEIAQAVLAKDVDLAIVYGVEAAYFIKQYPELAMTPVSPIMTSSLLQMFNIGTVGMRSGDEALRDLLNLAIAARWEAIQGVFQEFGIPLMTLPKPALPKASEAAVLKVAALLPMKTGNPAITDSIGEEARMGALLAEDLLGRVAADKDIMLDVLISSTPSLESLQRAAKRILATEKIAALIGGFNTVEASLLGQLAQEHNVLFFNIATSADYLRNQLCYQSSFHIEASSAMYLDAITAWLAAQGKEHWYVVYEASDEGRARFERARAAIEKSGGELLAQAEVQPRQFVYNDQLDTIAESPVDAVLMLLNAEDQEVFLAQYEVARLEPEIMGFPEPVSQTREFFFRFKQSAPTVAHYRLNLWETTLTEDGAQEINERLMARAGEPMEGTAWATYAAVKILLDAVIATDSQASTDLIAYLENPETVLDLHKGEGLGFHPWNHQLSQPLYLLKINPEVDWAMPLSDRVKVADLFGILPQLYLPELSSVEVLGQIGDGPEQINCLP